MDGNGRWATKRNLPRTAGHYEGIKSLKKVVLACLKYEIRYLSLYCFSTENWKRSEIEVKYLMGLFSDQILNSVPFCNENGVSIRITGDLDMLNPKIKQKASEAIEKTKDNNLLILNLLINYGGQDEIIRAVNKAINNGTTALTKDTIRNYFDNPDIPPPDIIARSAGEYRLSNFLLYDSAYAELMYYDTLWPDWDEKMIEIIFKDYQNRKRKFGGI